METGANKDIVPNSMSGIRSMLQIDLLTLIDIDNIWYGLFLAK